MWQQRQLFVLDGVDWLSWEFCRSHCKHLFNEWWYNQWKSAIKMINRSTQAKQSFRAAMLLNELIRLFFCLYIKTKQIQMKLSAKWTNQSKKSSRNQTKLWRILSLHPLNKYKITIRLHLRKKCATEWHCITDGSRICWYFKILYQHLFDPLFHSFEKMMVHAC